MKKMQIMNYRTTGMRETTAFKTVSNPTDFGDGDEGRASVSSVVTTTRTTPVAPRQNCLLT